MATNLAIDDDLLVQAQKIGNIKTKKETVNQALAEFIQRRKQEDVISMFGSVVYEPTYNYKVSRKSK